VISGQDIADIAADVDFDRPWDMPRVINKKWCGCDCSYCCCFLAGKGDDVWGGCAVGGLSDFMETGNFGDDMDELRGCKGFDLGVVAKMVECGILLWMDW
jgi:hypothetical protein